MNERVRKGRRRDVTQGGKALLRSARTFLNSYLFFWLQIFAACLFVAFRMHVAGVIAFGVLLCVILLVCEDVFATTLPFLALSCVATNCYDSYEIFMPYVAFAAIPVACVIAHFVVYHKPIRIGESFYGIGVVSVAILLGGIGYFSVMEYVYGAYYVLGLSVGMMLVYILMKSQFSVRRSYDIKERFSVIMTLMGVLCTAMIAIGYTRKALGLEYQIQGWLPFSHNNISTLLMFAMPFPLYLAGKRDWWAIFVIVFYGAICFTKSRGGLIFGAVELLVCAVYWIFQSEYRRRRLAYCLIAIGALLVCCGAFAWDVLLDRVFADNQISGDPRYTMIWQAWENFLKNPLVGTGLLESDLEYAGMKKRGALTWYHMMIPQVVGSMGLVGIFAYGYQIYGRVRLIFKRKSAWSLVLGISYLGILMMSQVNPGEFCPLPFELLTVLLFIFLEQNAEEKLPLSRW